LRKTRRTEITIETDRVVVIKKRKASILAWCPACAGQVQMVTPDEAAVIARVSSRTIYRWVEAGKLHFAETAEGFLLICPQSLLKISSNTPINR
jgi:excisionase family DNA binding protein